MNINRTIKLSFLLLAVMVFTMAVYGFAAANTVPTSRAGDGENVIGGYVITGVEYDLDANNPALISGMTFTLGVSSGSYVAPSSVYVKLISTGTDYTSCTASGATVTCNFSPGVSVLDTDQLRVIAAD